MRLAKRAPASNTDAEWLLDRRFGIVIDAGSSGSRVQIYSWKDSKAEIAKLYAEGKSASVLPHVEWGTRSGKDSQKKIEPGLSTFANHPGDIPTYLSTLVDHAKKVVPSLKWSSTPIFLQATAGMRLLGSAESDGIMSEVCQTLTQRSPFYLQSCVKHVEVITGQQEGLFGWVAVNYLLGGFTEESVNPISHEEAKRVQSTLGFLDMGGASAQIAFEPTAEQRLKHADDLTPVRLRMLDGKEVEHQVFVSTWLRYGTHQARIRHVENLISTRTPDADHLIHDPCLPRGLRLKDGEAEAGKPALVGSGSWQECLALTAPLLNKDADCPDKPCLFDGRHVPPIDFEAEQFVGISEYWYSSQDIFGLGDAYDYTMFAEKAEQFCARDWEDIEADLKKGGVFKAGVEIDRLELQCFKAAWIANVLYNGIELPRVANNKDSTSSFNKISHNATDDRRIFRSVDEIKGMTASWTLGKMILEASMQDSTLPNTFDSPDFRSRHPSIGSATLNAIIVLIALVGIIFIGLKKYPSSCKWAFRAKSERYQLVTSDEGSYLPMHRTSRKKSVWRMFSAILPRYGSHPSRPFRPSFTRGSASSPVIPLTMSTKDPRRGNGTCLHRSDSSDVLDKQSSPFLRSATPPRR